MTEGFVLPWLDSAHRQIGVAYVYAEHALSAIFAFWHQGRLLCFWLGSDAPLPEGGE